ncbi:uncharacterized protein LOC133484027 isoform X2 [Phyllopteryx taeniolatus]|uniref:uncharacterized protein LOC133484027 isoform X2 n=1 Tax=Phyllopteryx taeniolatus TaxID=161469 RepID=UPI002AD3CF73|nr:uncharacterized protein LOC133484027 isoform X2 [Phyllopteryx taeniolatus]
MAAVNRPPTARPQTNGGLHFRATSGVPNTGQKDPGPQGASQDPGPAPLPHMSTRPVFYVPTPPPPPFLHYQWPMPFPYNPFAGFPGMGYGMVMPQFPPPPYMEAPAYFMPHPHVQPLDYRCFLHPRFNAQGPLYQNPNQTKKVPPHHTFPVKETANSQVQTEPTEGSCSDKGSDSGRGTASCSPSSICSSQKDSAEVGKCTLPSGRIEKDIQVTGKSSSSKQAFVSSPAENNGTESCSVTLEKPNRVAEMVNRENHLSCKNDYCNIWSVSSQDCEVPLCSSPQEDEVIKETSVSVANILLRWSGGTPQEELLKESDQVVLPHNEDRLASKTDEKHEGPVSQTATKANIPVPGNDDYAKGIADCNNYTIQELLSESRREREAVGVYVSKTHPQNGGGHFLYNSNEVQDNAENDSVTNPQEDAVCVPYKLSSTSGVKRKLNESVWSVESLMPFIPSKEWIIQNGMFEPQMIAELNKDTEKDMSNQNIAVKANHDGNKGLRSSSSSSATMSDILLDVIPSVEKANQSHTPKKTAVQTLEMTGCSKQDPGMLASEKDPPACLQSNIAPLMEDIGENRSPEPAADESPNQKSCFIAQQAGSPHTADQDETPSRSSTAENILALAQCSPNNGEAVKSGNVDLCNDGHLRNHQLCVPVTDPRMAEFSPCLFIGFHCNRVHESKCPYENMKPNMGAKGKRLDARNGKADGVSLNGRMQKTQKKSALWRNKRHEKHNNHVANGHRGEPKSKGGDGENLQC